jgi:hypothetical protein
LLSTQSKSDRLLELGTHGRIGWGGKPKISQGVQQLRQLPYHLPVVCQRTLHWLQHLRITKLEVQYESLTSNKRADAKTLRSFPSECCHQSTAQLMQLHENFSDSAVGNHKNDYTQITILALKGSNRLPKNSDSDCFSDLRWGCS